MSKRVRRSTIIIGGCLGLFFGVAVARWVVFSAVILILLPLAWRVRQHDRWALVVLALFCAGVGWWRGSSVWQQLAPYRALALSKVVVVGRAASDGSYNQKQLVFTLEHVRLLAPYQVDLPGSIAAGGFGLPAVNRGDVVRVSGKLYPTRGNNIASISFAKLQVLESRPSVLDNFRRRFAAGLQTALPEPLAPFGLGLLLGQRTTLPGDVSQQLLVVGLTHIIAVSGYNLTIMVDAARRGLARRSKFQTAAACLLLLGTFLLLAGNSPSIIRASIISLLSIGAWYYGRVLKPMVLLLLAGAVTVFVNPLYLWGNVSWYLSFLAFFGVIVLAPPITRGLFGERAPPMLVKMLIESLVAELMTLPYVLHIFGQMSFVALPANLLIAAVVPLAMLLCAVAGAAGMLLPALAGWFAWPAMFVLTYMLDAAALLGRIPHAFIQNAAFGLAGMLAVYGLVALFAWRSYRRRLALTE